ncbi:MAG TPA: class I SAM-dependent methyltransferase [Bacteroidales bacterium]|nr:class I SAM-dependent methyltransferase [Bacteroidales bacterium]HPS15972.1 class I SAM-dependent methyltransferase [Bacteroidales bacterium]
MKIDTLKNETLLINKIINEPIKEHTLLLFNHFYRYGLACRILGVNNSHIVFDASCGRGYGSYILSQKAKKVIGLDINKNYLNDAKNMFPSEKICFLNYNELKKNTINKADKIVCIETYEHIPKKEIQKFILNLISHLKDNGDMLITIPLGNNKPSEYNDFHLNEPSIDVLFKQFSPYFNSIFFEIDNFINSFGKNEKLCYLLLNNYIKSKVK